METAKLAMYTKIKRGMPGKRKVKQKWMTKDTKKIAKKTSMITRDECDTNIDAKDMDKVT